MVIGLSVIKETMMKAKEKQFRITGTAYGNIVPDRLVADLLDAGWKMTTWHLDENHKPKEMLPGSTVALTLPPRIFYSMSNMFAHMETGEKMLMDDDKIYRLELGSDKVVVGCYGIDSVDSVLNPFYKSVDDLPDWVQKKIAVLSLFDPTRVNNDIANVGRRINKNVFWIYPEEQ